MPIDTARKPVGSTEMVANALRSDIYSGQLPPGAALKQDEIAAQYGVSHTPVREALKLLVAEGLASLQHNRGCSVAELSSDVARELMEFRVLVEPQLAAWALDRLGPADIDLARSQIAVIDTTKDPVQRLKLAAEFHRTIYARADRPFFLEQVDRARNNLNRYWILAWSDLGFPAFTQGEHQEILQLCIAKDRSGLMQLIARHIEASGKVVLEYCSRR